MASMINIMRKLLQAALLASALLPFTVLAQHDSSGPADTVTAEILELKIAETQVSTTLDEQAADSLIDLYRRALTNLERTRQEEESADEFQKSVRGVTDELAVLHKQRQDLDEAETSSIAESVSLSELEQSLIEEKTRLVDAEAQLSEYEDRLATQVTRPGPARERLNDARNEREAIGEQLNSADPSDELAGISEARRWYLQTRTKLLQAEIRKLDQELLGYPNRKALLEANRDLAKVISDRSNTRARLLEDAISQRRGADAELAQQQAKAAQQRLVGQIPVIRELAAGNVELSEKLAAQVIEVQSASDQRDDAKRQTLRLEEELRSIKSKLAIAGLSRAMGQLLVDQRRALPDMRAREKLQKKLQQQVVDVSLQQIELDEQRKDLLNGDALVDELTISLSARQSREFYQELETVKASRLTLIDKLIATDANLLQVLGELDLAQSQLIDTMNDYQQFLEERLLWVRNTSPIGIGVMGSIPADIKRIFAASDWKQLNRDFLTAIIDTPLIAVLLTGLVLLGFARRKFLARVDESARHLGKGHISDSLKALIFTALAAVPFPLVIYVAGKAVIGNAGSNEFSYVVASSLVSVGLDLMVIQFFIDTCRNNGLAIRHCGWTTFTTGKLRSELTWFRILFPALRMVGETSFALDSGPLVGGLAAVCITGAGMSFAVLIYRLYLPQGGILRQYLEQHPDRMLARYRSIWLGALTMLVPLLTLVWLAGYNYAGSLLIERCMHSFWLVLWLMILKDLIVRWLLLSYRRLEFKAMAEQREALNAGESNETGGDGNKIAFEGTDLEVAEPDINYEALNNDSRKLLRIIVAFIAAVYLWVIWSPVLPALGILDEYTLWSHMAVVNGENIELPITLMDLLWAIIVGLGTWVLAKGLPSLLELILLQRKDITTGARYTSTTLLRYTLIGIGIIWVFGILGGNWPQIQWLVAALGVGIGFGLQEIVANFISGLIILFEQPVRVGDVVSIGDTSGVVTRIQLRATTIRDWQRKELLVPNREIITNRLLNWSLTDNVIRLDISIGIDYRSDEVLAMKLAEEAASEHSNVLDDPPPSAVFDRFGDNALIFKLLAYLPSPENILKTRSELHTVMKRKFQDAGIKLGFPQLDVHLDTEKPVEIHLRSD